MGETKKKRLKTFPYIDAKEFQHPWDATATDALKSVPGLDKVIAKIMEYGLERIFYLENTAANVRVTARQFPRLHRSLTWGCKILGVEEPEMYVTLDPLPNAYTYGHTRPFIVLTSGLVDMLDDEERFFIIATNSATSKPVTFCTQSWLATSRKLFRLSVKLRWDSEPSSDKVWFWRCTIGIAKPN
jgi:hypothetical protein